jgi:hypothetical protein
VEPLTTRDSHWLEEYEVCQKDTGAYAATSY